MDRLNRYFRFFLSTILLLFSMHISATVYLNNQVLAVEKTPNTKNFPVTLDNKTLFSFSSNIPGIPPKARAERITKTLEKIANDYSVDLNSIEAINAEGNVVIFSKDEWIMSVTPGDAKIAKEPIESLAQSYLKKIQDSIDQYREKRSPEQKLLGIIKTFISTVAFLIIFGFINFIFPRIHKYTHRYKVLLFQPLRIQNWQILSAEQQAELFWKLLQTIRLLLILVLLYIYIPLVLSFFPATERFSRHAFESFHSSWELTWTSFIKYLPNLFHILIICVFTYYIVRLSYAVFQALEKGILVIPGFYRDWAKPTYKLTSFLIWAIGMAIAFPYLPGFNSPAFQGVSIVLGAIVTFGGASTISNIFGGFVTIYTRAFQLGDMITIGEYSGVVIEKSILSTRICTPNNEIITIPNSTIVASSIKNFSASLRDMNRPLILHTTVTLGYDLPWRKIHQALISAALATNDILQDPTPVVWQTSLDDFYVSYELRVHTNKPLNFKIIYAQLHQNIQDKCNEVGIEIMSPHYSALRDGNQTTIPSNYLDKNYQVPGFNIKQIINDAEDRDLHSQ